MIVTCYDVNIKAVSQQPSVEPPMVEKQAKYIAYLLRMWQEERDGQLIWRASLEAPGPGERHAFASLETLFEFLQAQVDGLNSTTAESE